MTTNRERSHSQTVEATVPEDAMKKRHTIADVGTALINALRFTNGISDTNGTTTAQSLSKENAANFGVQRTPATVDSKSDKTSTTSTSKFRRRSTFKGLASSITSMMRLQLATTRKQEQNKPKIKYENTYKMRPDTGKHIAVTKTEHVAGKVLQDMIGEKQYNQQTSGELSVRIANMIREKVKAMNFPRYRIVVQVVISQVCGQGLETASRCVWDASVDNYSCVTYQNDTTVAMAMIYGVYLE